MLTHCIKVQNVEAVDVLVRCGADPNLHNRKGVSPISAAAHKGNIPIMELLIQHGAAVNAVNVSGSTALIQVFTQYTPRVVLRRVFSNNF